MNQCQVSATSATSAIPPNANNSQNIVNNNEIHTLDRNLADGGSGGSGVKQFDNIKPVRKGIYCKPAMMADVSPNHTI